MTPFVSPPTDNRHKFLAVFGLALVVAGILSGTAIYTYSLDRKILFEEKILLALPQAGRDKAAADTVALNDRLVDITLKNEGFAQFGIGGVIAIGIAFSWAGFRGWKTRVEARDDRLMRLQEEKLRIEIRKLELEAQALEAERADPFAQHI